MNLTWRALIFSPLQDTERKEINVSYLSKRFLTITELLGCVKKVLLGKWPEQLVFLKPQ